MRLSPLHRQLRPLLVGTALALSPLLALSCSSNGGAAGGEIGAACSEDTECQNGSCRTDAQFPEGYCSQDCAESDCPAGATCQDYFGARTCLDDCSGDEECREGYVCDYQVCRAPCTKKDQCQGTDLCVSNRCKPPCKSDEECPQGRCQSGECLGPCKADKECIPGNVCDLKTGHCQPKPGKTMGTGCGASAECATAYCLPTRKICSVTCTSSKGCPSGYVCALEKVDKDSNGTFDATEADCVPAKGKGAAGELCDNDAACASGHCYAGFCMEACTDDAGCGTLSCQQVNIILNGGSPKFRGCLPRQGTSLFTIGTATEIGIKGLDVPPNATSFVLTATQDSQIDFPFVDHVADPAGRVLSELGDECAMFSQPIRYMYTQQISNFYVPMTPKLAIQPTPGVYSFYVFTSANPFKPVTVTAQMKLGRAEKGTLDINWFFLNLASLSCGTFPTLNAASAPTHAWFSKLRQSFTSILKSAHVTVGKQTFQDLKNPAFDEIDTSTDGTTVSELNQLLASSKNIKGKSMNIFLVRKIVADSVVGATVLGVSGAIPGPMGIHGTIHSGLALSMETVCFEAEGYDPGHTLAHEVGHYLGLSHNQETRSYPGLNGGKVVCPCPCGANQGCVYEGSKAWCRGEDELSDTDVSNKNLMYYAAENTGAEGNQLSASQIRILLDNPLVGF